MNEAARSNAESPFTTSHQYGVVHPIQFRSRRLL
jgi:hypothetical protein